LDSWSSPRQMKANAITNRLVMKMKTVQL